MMNYLLVTCLLVQLICTYYLTGKNILSVSVLTTLMFLISTTVFALLSKFYDDYTVSINTVVVIMSSNFFLLVGELVAGNLTIRLKKSGSNREAVSSKEPIKANMLFVYIVTFAGAIIGLYSYYNLYKYSLMLGNTGDLLRAVEYTRVARVSSSSSTTSILSYLGIAIEALSYIYFYEYAYNSIYFGIRKKGLLLPILSTAIMQIASTERIGFIKIIVVIITIYAIMLKKQNNWSKKGDKYIIRIAAVGAGIFVLIFVVLGALSNRLNIDSWTRSVGGYIGLPIMGLDRYLASPWKNNTIFGQQTLYSLYYNLNRIGFHFPVEKSFLPFFYWSSGSSNVYTSLVAPLHDYGIIGLLLTRVIIGWFYKVFSNYIRRIQDFRGKAFTLIMYGLFLYPVAITSIADSYLFFLNLPRLYLIIGLFVLLHGRLNIIKK